MVKLFDYVIYCSPIQNVTDSQIENIVSCISHNPVQDSIYSGSLRNASPEQIETQRGKASTKLELQNFQKKKGMFTQQVYLASFFLKFPL
jgi:hypothetical protein